MKFMDKVKDLFTEVDDSYYDDMEEEVSFSNPEPDPEPSPKPSRKRESYYESSEPVASERRSKVVTMPRTANSQVIVRRPERFGDAPEIVECLLSKRTVVLNLESARERDTSGNLCRRLVDFLSGATYAVHGDLKQVANDTFIIAPNGVNIDSSVLADRYGSDTDYVGDLGSSNLYI